MGYNVIQEGVTANILGDETANSTSNILIILTVLGLLGLVFLGGTK